MTEQEWQECSEPLEMLAFFRGKLSERKLRWFTIACARLVWDRIPEPEWKKAVEIAERVSDGLAPFGDLQAINITKYFTAQANVNAEIQRVLDLIVGDRSIQQVYALCRCTTFTSLGLSRLDTMAASNIGRELAGKHQPGLLREIFGNPFRPVTIGPSCSTTTVVSLAEAIYAERAFDRLPILADALEEAGCDNADILGDCRGPGPHVRGCWVVDLILGKA